MKLTRSMIPLIALAILCVSLLSYTNVHAQCLENWPLPVCPEQIFEPRDPAPQPLQPSQPSAPAAQPCPADGTWPEGCVPAGEPCPPTGTWPRGCVPGGSGNRPALPPEPAMPSGPPCPADGTWPEGCVPAGEPCPLTGTWPRGCVPGGSGAPAPQTPSQPDPTPAPPEPTPEPEPEPSEPSTIQALCYQEVNGVVMAEAESQHANGWTLERDPAGYAGAGYYRWSDIPDDLLGDPGTGTLTYLFKIDNPGRYYMRLHNFHNNPRDATWSNDAWVRMDGAPWFKAVSWATQHGQWGWATARENPDHDVDDPPFFDLDAGIHTLDISARSGYFGIDRIALFQAAGYEELLGRDYVGPNAKLDAMPESAICAGYTAPTVR